MRKTARLAAAPFLGAALLLAAPPAGAFSDAEKKEIGEIVKQYLIENPEIMLEVQDALEEKIAEARNQQARTALDNNREAIFESPVDLVLGNPKGDVTIVEFFDYNCGYCKQSLGTMTELLGKDKNIRFVLKEWPILGPDSDATHRVSDAVRKVAPEKYGDFFMRVMSAQSRTNEDKAIDAAVSLGIDEATLRRTMKDSPNDATQAATHQLALTLGFNGTPAYIVGDETLPGAYGIDAFDRKIANLRGCGKATC
ncbi:DsbA family protein [Rhizobiaceae bacterium BDR2-2]|uniref:DsbA family protein n=1 Tax=Ectorhizobium quercum TaxID=2965071 RepID=A0AAE3SW67_9HYPH|nr:DsbA family protein [Ectorhizobium quercum]MCX8998872.1 DsbA family protein [Ectorhizobium quercum]